MFVGQREGGEKGYSLTNSILRSLEQLIEAKATEIAPKDLRSVAQFYDTSFSWEGWHTEYCFVTIKPEPQDFDGCWSKEGVDPDKLDPVLLDFSQDRAAQKAKYGGELFIAQAPANEQHVFLGFFQRDRRNQRKGIIGIKLSEEVL